MGGGARLRRAGAGVRGADRVKAALFEQLRADRLAKRPVVLMTRLPEGDQRLLDPHGAVPEGVTPTLFDAARLAAARDEASTVEESGATIFLQPFNPPLRLIIVGAVHIAQALARMARWPASPPWWSTRGVRLRRTSGFPAWNARRSGPTRRWQPLPRTVAPPS